MSAGNSLQFHVVPLSLVGVVMRSARMGLVIGVMLAGGAASAADAPVDVPAAPVDAGPHELSL